MQLQNLTYAVVNLNNVCEWLNSVKLFSYHDYYNFDLPLPRDLKIKKKK